MVDKKENKFTFQPKIHNSNQSNKQMDKTGDNFAKENLRSQNLDIQNLIDMCSKKLEIEPTHKKALLLRASSYIKKNELDKVNRYNNHLGVIRRKEAN
jgi:hypothetical protein